MTNMLHRWLMRSGIVALSTPDPSMRFTDEIGIACPPKAQHRTKQTCSTTPDHRRKSCIAMALIEGLI